MVINDKYVPLLYLAGVLLSGFKTFSGEQSGEKLALDMVMTRVAFIPGYGWIVSGVYMVLDLGGAFDCISQPLPSTAKDCVDENINQKDNLQLGGGGGQ